MSCACHVIVCGRQLVHKTIIHGTSDIGSLDTIEIISLQRTHFKVLNVHFPIFLIHFEPLKSGQPLYKGQNDWPQRVVYSEVPLYF